MIEKNTTNQFNISTSSPSKMNLCLIFLLGTILSSDILWVKILTNQIYRNIAQYVYIAIVLAIIFLYYHKQRMKIYVSLETWLFIVTVLMLLCAAFVTGDSINAYFFKIALIVGGYYGAHLFTIEEFYQTFRRIMLTLMITSTLMYVMKITGIGYSVLPTNQISTGVQYSTIGFANMYNNSFYVIPRAQSIFWESGVYAAYLNVLLMLELFYKEQIDKKIFLLILVSIATTMSTTGYVVMIILLIAYTLNKRQDQFHSKILIASLLIIIVIVIVINETILYQLTSKVSNNTESFKDRWLSIAGNIEAIKEAPLFGLGPVKSQIVIESYIRSNGGIRSFNNLNTILANYSIFGLLPFVYYLFHLVKYHLSFKISFIGKLLILTATIFLLSSTGYQYSPFFTLIFMFQINDKINLNPALNNNEQAI